MCGICGYFILNDRLTINDDSVIRKITSTLAHRGPDDSGVWINDKKSIALGHRRLSILDLSQEGHQPMISKCKRYVISYNGEVYNYLKIKKELEDRGLSFKGNSDVEVIVNAISVWGIEKSLSKFNGMFAFAIFDKKEEKLYLARDRVGIKPLYYGIQENIFYFSSELKAIHNHPDFKPILDNEALTLFFRYNYIPCPYSIYKNIKKLEQGSYLSIDNSGKITEKKYWNLKDIIQESKNNVILDNKLDIENKLENILQNSVTKRMISDVPLGAFLSGGVDSSLVVSLMQKSSSNPVKTFTIGFDEKSHDESIYAKKVAEYLHTDHTEIFVSSKDALDVIPELSMMYDEPFADFSQIPTFLVSKLTRNYVTVALSGDGGDETFGGYNRYIWANKIWNLKKRMPLVFINILKKLINQFGLNHFDTLSNKYKDKIPYIFNHKLFSNKLLKLIDAFEAKSEDDLYLSLLSHWKDPKSLVLNSKEEYSIIDNEIISEITNFVERMMYYDSIGYMVDDILTKVDRASMAVNLEVRVPFLDHEVIEFSKTIPHNYKIKDGINRWIIRQILYKYVPKELIERPKMGFVIPLNKWLKHDLKEWSDSLINEKKLKDEGILNHEMISKVNNDHQKGIINGQRLLWNVLMFQSWKEKWM